MIFNHTTTKRYLNTLQNVTRVIVSQSNDIYSNLALEQWIYRNVNLQQNRWLLLWQNNPCVVIGRHQNAWTEANVPFLRSHGIALARRDSGGGTVFHDMGNLNCTFFTSKSDYNRRRNLDLICQAITETRGFRGKVNINEREDILLNDTHKVSEFLFEELIKFLVLCFNKISGTAAKLGQKNAYHHCTVLVNVDSSLLHKALKSNAVSIW